MPVEPPRPQCGDLGEERVATSLKASFDGEPAFAVVEAFDVEVAVQLLEWGLEGATYFQIPDQLLVRRTRLARVRAPVVIDIDVRHRPLSASHQLPAIRLLPSHPQSIVRTVLADPAIDPSVARALHVHGQLTMRTNHGVAARGRVLQRGSMTATPFHADPDVIPPTCTPDAELRVERPR
jgi:hypothetical protein